MSEQSLYTVIVDYAGGTYISQVKSVNERAALYAWCETFQHETDVPVEARSLIAGVRENLDNDENDPVALAGLTGIWCTSTLNGEALGLINIVRTI